MQTDLFRSQDMQQILERVERVEKSTDKVRKGLFGRNTSIENRMNDLESRVEELSRENYNLKKYVYEKDDECIVAIEKVM